MAVMLIFLFKYIRIFNDIYDNTNNLKEDLKKLNRTLTPSEKEEILKSAIRKGFNTKKIIQGKDFMELLKNGYKLLPKKSAVILSPGAKSFDSFKNYKKRIKRCNLIGIT